MKYLFVLFLWLPSFCISQEEYHTIINDTTHYNLLLSLNVGPNFPGSDYGTISPGASTIEPEVYGYATTGYDLNFSCTYKLDKNIGTVLEIGNDLNQHNFCTEYLAGIRIMSDLNNQKIHLNLLFSIGLATANIQSDTWGNDEDGSIGSTSYSEIPGLGMGFCYSGGLELSYKIGRRIYFNCNVSYVGSRINFANGSVYREDYYLNTNSFTITKYTESMFMSFSMIRIDFGVTIPILRISNKVTN